MMEAIKEDLEKFHTYTHTLSGIPDEIQLFY